MCGRVDVPRLMEETDARTFAHWKVFCAIDAGIHERADWHTASLLAMLRNVNSSGDSFPATPKDFVVDVWGEEMKRRLLDGDGPKAATLKETVAFLSGIPGAKVAVLKPEAFEE